MSNRDGRNTKNRKFRAGKLCPKCGKGRLEKADCSYQKGHKDHVICKTCYFCNF